MYVLEHPTRRIFRVPPVQPMDHNQHTHNSWNTTATNFFRLWSVTYTYVEWLPMYKIKKDTTKRKRLLILTSIYFPYDVFSFYVPYIYYFSRTYLYISSCQYQSRNTFLSLMYRIQHLCSFRSNVSYVLTQSKKSTKPSTTSGTSWCFRWTFCFFRWCLGG